MTDTTAATGLKVQQWDRKFFTEALNAHIFKPFMGTGTNSLIQVKEDLTKKPGDSVTYSLINRLSGTSFQDGAVLEGNEEDMVSRSHKVTMHQERNGVRVAAYEEQISAISLRNGAKDTLMDWSMELWRDRCIEVLGDINGVEYSIATAGQRNTWLVDNTDRVIFGDGSIGAGAVHATDMTAITAGMTLDSTLISLMKRKAKTASPRIRPLKPREGARRSDSFVLFADSRSMRDLKTDASFITYQSEARKRGKDNPIFSGADYIWDNVAIYEVEDIATLGLVGAGAAVAVSPIYMCGAQALGHAWAKRPRSVEETFDYGDKKGCAVEQWYGIEKLQFGSGATDVADLKDHGVFTAYVAAAAD